MPFAQVAIIGAGVAGLVCARILTRGGFSVKLLEASDGVGGRVRTDEVEGFLLDRGFQVDEACSRRGLFPVGGALGCCLPYGCRLTAGHASLSRHSRNTVAIYSVGCEHVCHMMRCYRRSTPIALPPPRPLLSLTNKVFIEAYPEPTRQLNYKKLNLKKFDPGAVVRYDGGFHLVSDPIRKPG